MHIFAYNQRMNFEQSKIYAEVLKTLAHPIRILLVGALTEEDKCVCELVKVAKIDQSGISRHLAKLSQVGILSNKKMGKQVIYHLETPCILNAFGCALDVLKAATSKKRQMLKG
jgi:DNA-binding transcriptional ArsR family regulator